MSEARDDEVGGPGAATHVAQRWRRLRGHDGAGHAIPIGPRAPALSQITTESVTHLMADVDVPQR
jgi:hypothetical protein